jgi:hypothetical protein
LINGTVLEELASPSSVEPAGNSRKANARKATGKKRLILPAVLTISLSTDAGFLNCKRINDIILPPNL